MQIKIQGIGATGEKIKHRYVQNNSEDVSHIDEMESALFSKSTYSNLQEKSPKGV
jgi:hypothetical protein